MVLLGGAGAILLFGKRPDMELPRDRVVVQYWEKWTGDEAEKMREVVEEFNRTVGAEKGIHVQFMSMSNIQQKTLVATAAGVPPDIAGLFDSQLVQYAAKGALEPLDEMAAEHGIGPGLYKPVYWKTCTYEGRLWALVSTPSAVALHYNQHEFYRSAGRLRQAGLDPFRPPRTLEELEKYAIALDRFDPQVPTRMVASGYLPMEPDWFTVVMPYWFGTWLFDESRQEFTLNDEPTVRAFSWIQGFAERLGPTSMGEFRSGFGAFNSSRNPFMIGKVAMVQQGPWMGNFIFKLNPRMAEVLVPRGLAHTLPAPLRLFNYAYRVSTFPSAKDFGKEVTFCGADLLVIPAGAKHKREAFEFIAFVQRPEISEKLCASHCKNSPMRATSSEFRTRHPNPHISEFERLSSLESARGLPQVPVWTEAGAELTYSLQKMYLGEGDPREVLNEAQRRVSLVWKEWRDRRTSRRPGAAQ
jgi:ABC-type glycerol-3-phosphate transport system substrate-binding protein